MKVLVIGPDDRNSKGGMATVISAIRSSKILNEKYDVDIFPSYIDGNIVVRLLYSLFAYLKFLTVLHKYDIFHIHVAAYGSTFRKSFYLKSIKRAGKKVILHIHGAKYLVFYDELNEKRKKYVKKFLSDADMVLALSDGWKKSFEQIFGLTNCFVLENGVDADALSEAVRPPEECSKTFVMLGRIGERKGSYDLLEAVAAASKKEPDIKCFFAGDGEIEKFRNLVKERRLEKNIEIIGWADLNKKIQLLHESATVVLPSYNEGLPMAILEGMSCGKAIISTTVGAIPEVITEENGILVTAGDVEALTNALLKLCGNTAFLERAAKNNMKKISEEYSVETMHKRLSEYYDRLG